MLSAVKWLISGKSLVTKESLRENLYMKIQTWRTEKLEKRL